MFFPSLFFSLYLHLISCCFYNIITEILRQNMSKLRAYTFMLNIARSIYCMFRSVYITETIVCTLEEIYFFATTFIQMNDS